MLASVLFQQLDINFLFVFKVEKHKPIIWRNRDTFDRIFNPEDIPIEVGISKSLTGSYYDVTIKPNLASRKRHKR